MIGNIKKIFRFILTMKSPLKESLSY